MPRSDFRPLPLATVPLTMSAFALRAAASTSRAARVTSVCARSCRIRSRALHQRRELPYPVEEGLGSFLPPQSLKMIAEDYQQGLLDRLNDQVRGALSMPCFLCFIPRADLLAGNP